MKIFILLFIVVAVIVILQLLKRASSMVSVGLYKRRDLFSSAESRFLLALDNFVAGRARVFSKVRLADLASPLAPLHSSAWHTAFNKIQSKHVDFVLADSTGRLLCCLELDDSSHLGADRVKRDDFVNSVFKDIGLPIFHIPARSNYSSVDFKALDSVLNFK